MINTSPRLIAQWTEHQIPILGVEGSNPSKPAIRLNCIWLDSNQRRLDEKRIMSPMPSATWLQMLVLTWSWWDLNPRPFNYLKTFFHLILKHY